VGGITIAWAIGLGIIGWRTVITEHRPPMPGQLLGASGFFALCAIIAEYPPARTAATLLAFGIDIAAYLQVPVVAGPPAATGPRNTAVRTDPIVKGRAAKPVTHA
jgi:hypothetical protein